MPEHAAADGALHILSVRTGDGSPKVLSDCLGDRQHELRPHHAGRNEQAQKRPDKDQPEQNGRHRPAPRLEPAPYAEVEAVLGYEHSEGHPAEHEPEGVACAEGVHFGNGQRVRERVRHHDDEAGEVDGEGLEDEEEQRHTQQGDGPALNII